LSVDRHAQKLIIVAWMKNFRLTCVHWFRMLWSNKLIETLNCRVHLPLYYAEPQNNLRTSTFWLNDVKRTYKFNERNLTENLHPSLICENCDRELWNKKIIEVIIFVVKISLLNTKTSNISHRRLAFDRLMFDSHKRSLITRM